MAAKKPAPEKQEATIRNPLMFAKYLASQVRQFGISETARRAKLPKATLARKCNDHRLMNAKEMARLAPLFGVSIAK